MSMSETPQRVHPDLQELYLRYGCCMAYIAVLKDGDEQIGSAFHVGEGVFVTARHVLEGAKVKEMCLTDPGLYYQSELFPKETDGSYVITRETPRQCERQDGMLEVIEGP